MVENMQDFLKKILNYEKFEKFESFESFEGILDFGD